MLDDCQFYGTIQILIGSLFRIQLFLYLNYLKNVMHWLELLSTAVFKYNFVGPMVQKMRMNIIQIYMCILYQHSI